mgnify:CR=1
EDDRDPAKIMAVASECPAVQAEWRSEHESNWYCFGGGGRPCGCRFDRVVGMADPGADRRREQGRP